MRFAMMDVLPQSDARALGRRVTETPKQRALVW
jgi:hypothetical protein